MNDAKWIEFRPAALPGQKTGRWLVLTKGGKKEIGGIQLGLIRWWGAWRKYAFFPEGGTLYEPASATSRHSFDERMAERRRRPA